MNIAIPTLASSRRDYASDTLEETLGKAAFEVDKEFATIVICGCYFPNPAQFNPEIFLTQMVQKFQPLCSSKEYRLILLTAGTVNRPNISILAKAYWNIPRSFRKNLKQLFIVGEGGWFQTMLTFFLTTLFSPKMSRKIVKCFTLNDLASSGVDTSQISFPSAVYESDGRLASKKVFSRLPSIYKDRKQFGVELRILMSKSSNNTLVLPMVVRDCFRIIRDGGLEVEGIFRKGGKVALLRGLESAIDRGDNIDWNRFADRHILCGSILKTFLASLPSPIISSSLYSHISDCPIDGKEDSTASIRSLLMKLDPYSFMLLRDLVILLKEVHDKRDQNLMDSSNLATVFAPVLIHSPEPEVDARMCRLDGTKCTVALVLKRIIETSVTFDLQV